MKPEVLSQELRSGKGNFLGLRRGIVGLAMVASGSMGLITLYQMRIIKHLPEPPLPGLDANRVDASAEAYSRFSTPDGILGLGNYTVTMGLAAMGGQDRAQKQPWIPLMLAAKVAFDLSQAIRLFLIKSQNTMHSVPGAFWLLAQRLPPSPCSFQKRMLPFVKSYARKGKGHRDTGRCFAVSTDG
jgi:hypothetical protein